MLLEFDPEKDRRNQVKHGISLARLTDMTAEIAGTTSRSATGEARAVIIGRIDTGIYTAVVTYRGDRVRVISLRPASPPRTEDLCPDDPCVIPTTPP